MVLTLFLALLQDDSAIAGAARKTSELKSYAAHISMSIEGGGENAVDLIFEGGYSEEEGIYLKGDYLKVPMGLYRKGGKTAVIDPADKQWRDAEEVKQAKTKRVAGKNFRIPHEEIKGIEGKIKDVKKTEAEKGCDTYTAELTEAGAKSFLPGGGMGGIKAAGDVKVWINADGYIAEIMIILIAEGSAQGKDFKITNTRTIRFSKFNAYKPEVPEEAKKALEK